MKKLLPFFLLLFICERSLAQKCDTTSSGKTINCIDANGLKQGYWEYNKKNVYMSADIGLGSKEGCRNIEIAYYELLSSGHYTNGKKFGMWYYYSHPSSDARDTEKQINYYEDGSFSEENLFLHYRINVSADSSEINGYLVSRPDTMFINCKQQQCKIIYKDVTIKTFSGLEHLEFELGRASVGVYDRDIRNIKAE